MSCGPSGSVRRPRTSRSSWSRSASRRSSQPRRWSADVGGLPRGERRAQLEQERARAHPDQPGPGQQPRPPMRARDRSGQPGPQAGEPAGGGRLQPALQSRPAQPDVDGQAPHGQAPLGQGEPAARTQPASQRPHRGRLVGQVVDHVAGPDQVEGPVPGDGPGELAGRHRDPAGQAASGHQLTGGGDGGRLGVEGDHPAARTDRLGQPGRHAAGTAPGVQHRRPRRRAQPGHDLPVQPVPEGVGGPQVLDLRRPVQVPVHRGPPRVAARPGRRGRPVDLAC